MMLRVKGWDDGFENSKSRGFRHKSQCTMPNKQGLGYRRLLLRKDGPALFGAWCAMVQALSRMEKPRDGWVTDTGKKTGEPLTALDLAQLTLFPAEVCGEMLRVCAMQDIGWLVVADGKDTAGIPQGERKESAGTAEDPHGTVDLTRLDRTRQEGAPRAREGDAKGEAGSGKEVTCSLPLAGAGGEEVAVVVEKCRVALGRLRECGPDWNRLSLEHLVELVRSEPRANLERVVRRIEQDWKGQSVPAIKTPPMIVRQCLGWDVADGGRNAKKNAAPTVEELRERRMGGRRNDE